METTSEKPIKKRYALKQLPGNSDHKFSVDYEQELNSEQFGAVTNTEGPQLVIAGAGSGKTRTLIYRVAYLVDRGIPPDAILLLTFTRKAAQEMMRRASLLLDERCKKVNGGTFHSFANSVLRKHAERIGYPKNFSIVDQSDSQDIISLLRTEMGLAGKDRRFPKKTTIQAVISKATNTGKTFSEILSADYPQFLEEEGDIEQLAVSYSQYKESRGIMDYDDLLVRLLLLLREHVDVRQALSQKHRYIMIDEFQDTNKLQSEIARHLASEHDNIMVVGDDSQSIYAFRGANFRNIMDFPNMFPNCTLTTLEQNYRSTQPVLSFANLIIESAEEKYEKHLFSEITGEQKPLLIRTTSIDEQAEFICQRVLELREEGVPLNDIAVLFRSAWQSNELEVALSTCNIPFVKYGGLKFIQAAHVKDVLALLRVTYNPDDAIGWHRLLLLLEGIGPRTASDLTKRIVDHKQGYQELISAHYQKKKFTSQLRTLHQAISDITTLKPEPSDAVARILKFYTPLLEQNYEDYRKRSNDLESLVRIAERYRTTEDFLSDITLEPPETSQVGALAEEPDDEKLTLSTIHSAKGLEWHSVFLISLIDGHLPASQSLKSPEEIEEERRLFYVASTRAKVNLHLMVPEFCKNYGFSHFGAGLAFSMPSRFLSQIPDLDVQTDEWVLSPDLSHWEPM